MFTKPKLLSCLAFALTVSSASLAQAADYTDGWWNPALSGMGLNVIHKGDTVAVTWYHYDDNSNSTFLNLSGKLNGNTLSGKLYRSHGTPPGPLYSASALTQAEVGSATLTFSSDNQAIFAYNYDGKQGNFGLERFGFGNTGTGTGTGSDTGNGEVYSTQIQVRHSSCNNASSNGTRDVPNSTLSIITHGDGTVSVTSSATGYTYKNGSGTFSGNGHAGTINGFQLLRDSAGKLLQFMAVGVVTSGEKCIITELVLPSYLN
ncbi:hypothetical protein AGMMS49960_15810 [Betaproteobacteria bacterium]|nr:hypothetical protein AGMMS49543_08490 [Betaproteobacteria bacterium]GHU02772.1 hypothetical protein AGMMS49960_15810 [Betaproteobacteria bacterium]GHU18461.1 hypothetical protein AGMMS50243_08540 [Betaproteobacteria bacterium]